MRLAKKQEIGEETAFEDLEQLVSKEAKLLHQNEMLKEVRAVGILSTHFVPLFFL